MTAPSVAEEDMSPSQESHDPAVYIPSWVTIREWDTGQTLSLLILENGASAVAIVLREAFEWRFPHPDRPAYVAAAMAPCEGESPDDVIHRLVDGVRMKDYFASQILKGADRVLTEARRRGLKPPNGSARPASITPPSKALNGPESGDAGC